MSDRFTWFGKFTDVLEKVGETDRGRLALAVIWYGSRGVEPDFEYPLSALFETFREDVDNSKKARENGRVGGSSKRGVPKGAKGGSKGACANTEALPDQTRPDQTNTNQTKPASAVVDEWSKYE